MAKPKTLIEELAEHRKLLAQQQQTIVELEAKAKDEAKQKVEEFAQATFGMSVAEIFGFPSGKGHKLKGTKVAPKYRDPNGVEWVGRSQPPREYRKALGIEVITAKGKPLSYKVAGKLLDQDGLLALLDKKGYRIADTEPKSTSRGKGKAREEVVIHEEGVISD